MKAGELWAKLRPRYVVPPLPAMSAREKLALGIGTGLGSGFLKPFAPSWGSIPGFFYFILVARLPLPAALAIFALVLWPSVWSGTVCERLLGKKDPRPVVIDEIAAVPFALWPLWLEWPHHPLTWVLLFGVYRLMDFWKPWPADHLQVFKGGMGILIDDVISSTYMGLGLWAFIHYLPGRL